MTARPGDVNQQWPNGTFWLHVGWLIDGSGQPASRGWYIEVCDGVINQVTSQPPDFPPENLVDLTHATVMPMLMDAHVHLALSGTSNPRQRKTQLAFDPGQVAMTISDHLASHWCHGVSAVREAGDRSGSVWHYLHRRSAPSRPPVSVALTRWAWHAPGRYGTMIGQSPGPETGLYQAAAGHFSQIDHVKVIQSGINSIDRFGHQGPPQFSTETLSQLVNQAHQHQIKVMVHANGETAVGSAIDARCDSIEHGYFMGRRNIERMADARIAWVPTIIPMAALAESQSLTKHQREIAQRTVDHQLEQVHLAHTLGVPIGLGTDAGSQGVDHGIAVHQELALLISAGISLEQAISFATAQNARLLGRVRCGALTQGFNANFLVVPGGPDQLLQNLGQNFITCCHGQWQPSDDET